LRGADRHGGNEIGREGETNSEIIGTGNEIGMTSCSRIESPDEVAPRKYDVDSTNVTSALVK
jgi:hypothetical protein